MPLPHAVARPLRGRAVVTVACLLALGSASAAQRYDAAGNPILESGRWGALSVPGDASGLTVEELFGDELDPALYQAEPGDSDARWALYVLDAATGAYDRPALDDSLEPGRGFWIIHVFDGDVVLDLPAGVPAASTVASAPCKSAAGCFVAELPAGEGAGQYAFLGSPFIAPFAVSDVVLRTTAPENGTDPCTEGCDLDTGFGLRYVVPGLYTFDPSLGARGDFVESLTAATVSPWEGFFTGSNPGALAGLSPRLLLPAPASSDGAGPRLPGSIDAVVLTETDGGGTDLSRLNDGAAATSWSLIADGAPVPSDLRLDANGVLRVVSDDVIRPPPPPGPYWTGRVRAANGAGASTASIRVCVGRFGPCSDT